MRWRLPVKHGLISFNKHILMLKNVLLTPFSDLHTWIYDPCSYVYNHVPQMLHMYSRSKVKKPQEILLQYLK